MENWQDSLDEGLAEHPSLAKFKDKSVSDLFKSYTEMEAWKGGAVRIPTADSPASAFDEMVETFQRKGINLAPVPEWDNEDQVAAYRKAIGVPSEASEYEIEGLEEDAAGKVKDLAHKMGLTKQQAGALVDHLTEIAEEGQAMVAQENDSRVASLKEAWGSSYEARMARLASAGKDLVGMDVDMNTAGYLMMDKLLDAVKGTPQGEKLVSAEVGATRAEVQQKIDDLRAKMLAHDYQPDPDVRRRDLERLTRLTDELGRAA